MINGQINCKWQFSIAMLVYQRVYCTLNMCSLSLSLALALQVLLNSVATDKQSIPRHLLESLRYQKKTQKHMRIIRHIQTLLSYHLSCSQTWVCRSSGLSPLSKNMMEYLVMAIEQCSKPENIQMLVEKRDSPFMDSDVTQLNL